jgi:NADH-quinone oxidoreductase subunit M
MSNYNFSSFEVNFLFLCFLFGFGVKLPIWPFYGWLPKAHVEASTNFSIFLSGVLVKFAFFGLFKCLLVIELEPTFIYVYPFLILGIVDSVLKLFYQIDLKKLVAYSTVVEMH